MSYTVLIPFNRSKDCYMQKLRSLVSYFLFSILTLMAESSVAQDPIYQKNLPPTGQGEFVFSVDKWGKYSIEAQSPEGVALKLIDRKVGLRDQDGIIGERNGRIDAFFDFGEYKVVTQSHKEGSAPGLLKVYPFMELNAENPQYLSPLRDYRETLEDHQQRSYWIYLEKESTIFFEVLGRNVSDVQLWRNGHWRVDLKRVGISSEPYEGNPLKGYRIVQKLEAGYYLLTMYGGEVVDWSEQSDKHPVYFRWEVPRFPSTGMGTFKIPPCGYSQFIVSSAADNFVLTAPDKKENYTLQVFNYDGSQPTLSSGRKDSIHARSKEPVCSVRSYGRSGHFIVRVTGKPGRQFTLKSLESFNPYISVPKSGFYWISTVHTGFPQDQIGVTGGLASKTDGNEVIKSSVDSLDSERRIYRTFNLLNRVSLIFWVDEDGKYEFTPGGKEMEISVRRFFLDSVQDWLKTSSKKMSVNLERGYYLVQLDPVEKGIAELEIKRTSLVGMVKEIMGAKPGELINGKPNLQIPSINLSNYKNYRLFLNSQSSEIVGLVLRSLPLNLEEALPVHLQPGEPVEVKIAAPEAANLQVTDSEGKHYSFKINGKQVQSPTKIEEGYHTLTLAGDSMVCVMARTVALSRLPSAKPDPFPTGKDNPIPLFPELNPGKASYFDMVRNDTKVYEFTVDKPGIYRFETTGRLKTSLTLRDRFVLQTHHESANGVGRNALIQAYMLPGRYQTIVKTLGQSTGRLGLSLKINELIDGGTLTSAREKRHKVPAGVGIEYRVPITQAGSYNIISQGQGGYFPARFDEAQGWPLINPGDKADISRKLLPGEYKLISLPKQRETLRITRLTETQQSREYEGKGPHELLVNKPVRSVWMEDSTAQTREPARYILNLSAPAKCRLSSSAGFEAKLFGQSFNMRWEGTTDTLLPMGKYTIEIMSQKRRNHAEYHLSVTTSMLIPGLSYTLQSQDRSKDFVVSVGQKTVVELFSQGMRDVAAALYTKEDKKFVAANDDGTNDWNFKISRVLDPGLYTLSVENRGTSHGLSEIVMTSLTDTTHSSWPLNQAREIDLTGKIHTIPIDISGSTDVLNVSVYGGSTVGGIIEIKDRSGAYRALNEREDDTLSLSAAVGDSGSYRVRIWSADHLNEKVVLSINTARFQDVTIGKLQRGIKTDPSKTGTLSSAWLRVDMRDDSLNHYRLKTDDFFTAVRTASSPNSGFKEDYQDYISSLSRTLFVELQWHENKRFSVEAENVNLENTFAIPITHRPRAFSKANSGKSVTVFEAAMKSGIPMVGTVSENRGDFLPGGIRAWAGARPQSRRAICAALPDDSHKFLVWNADVKSSGTGNVVEINSKQLKIRKVEKLTFGNHEWIPEKPEIRQYNFNESSSATVKLTIPRGGMAVWLRPDGSRTTFATDKQFDNYVFRENSGTLYCVNLEDKGYFHIQCIAAEGKQNQFRAKSVIVPGVSPFEYNFSRPGIRRISISGKMADLIDKRFFVSGAAQKADWWTGNGMYVPSMSCSQPFALQDLPSVDPELPAGFLDLDHGGGWTVANVYPDNDLNTCWGNIFDRGKKQQIHFPRDIDLENGVNWYSFPIKEPTHVQISSESNCVGILMKDNKALQTYVGTDGFAADIPLTKGTYDFGLRSIGDFPLDNSTMTVSYKPIEELTEKNPPRIRLASGESKILRFTLPQKSKIGIGLSTNREVLSARLYTNDFILVARGQQQFLSLDKGTYYLWLNVPDNQEPAECVVKLVGQDVAPDGPPENVIRKFKKLEKEDESL